MDILKYHGEMKHCIAGLVGGLGVVILFLILFICFKCYDYSPLYITNTEVDMQFNGADSLDVAKLNLLKELEVKGILFNSQRVHLTYIIIL